MGNGDGEAVFFPRFPRTLRIGLAASTIVHDLSIFVAAVAAFQAAPPSLRNSLGPIEWIWICMLLSGSVAGIAGRMTGKPAVHVVGCILMAFGMYTWTVAALTQQSASGSTISVAAAFFAGGTAMVYRAFATVVKTFLLAK